MVIEAETKKLSRKNESPELSGLQFGKGYSRDEVASLTKVRPLFDPREWTGIVEFSNCFFIFVTLDKTGRKKEHAYEDRFEGRNFFWDSQATNTPTTPKVVGLKEGVRPVLLFARVREKLRNKTQPFFYCGRLKLEATWGSEPVRFHWTLGDFPNGLGGSPELDELAQWRSQGDLRKAESPAKAPPPQGPNRPTKRSFLEGAKITVTANRYERDPRARGECIRALGCQCWICGFDFHKIYGELGRDYIVVHHRVPIAVRAAGGEYQFEPERDLVPLCANCHAMVHRNGNDVSPGSLPVGVWKKLVELRKAASLELWDTPAD